MNQRILLMLLMWTFAFTAAFEAGQVRRPLPRPPEVVPPENYVLERGDQLTIRVFNHPELEDTVQIRPDGKISLVLMDDEPAAGLTTRQLDERLTERYSRLFKDIEIAVIVRTFSGSKVYVGGEVGQAGFQPLQGRFTALTAILQAGGFRNTARTDSVILLRDDGGKPRAYRLDLKNVLAGGTADVTLQPFDVVYVPMSRIAKVDKFVDEYIRQLIPIGTSAGFTYVLGDRTVLVPR
jgi:protein involved in polysaccharide export with SLBB domain